MPVRDGGPQSPSAPTAPPLPGPPRETVWPTLSFVLMLLNSSFTVVLDNGPIHVSKAAMAARAHWLTVEWLPKYARELNDIEPVWRDRKAHHLAHQTFTDGDDLDQAIHAAVTSLNAERNIDPLVKQRISA